MSSGMFSGYTIQKSVTKKPCWHVINAFIETWSARCTATTRWSKELNHCTRERERESTRQVQATRLDKPQQAQRMTRHGHVNHISSWSLKMQANMCTYMHMIMHIYIYIYACISLSLSLSLSIYIYMQILNIYIYIYTQLYIYIYRERETRTHVCMCTCCLCA